MSFLSVEPPSKVVLENYSNSLLAQFDSQLGIIADRYLAFFQERLINLALVLVFIHYTNCSTCNVQFPDEISRQLSQCHPISRTFPESSLIFSFEVSNLYGNSIRRQKLLMPHSTHEPNHPPLEQHGRRLEII